MKTCFLIFLTLFFFNNLLAQSKKELENQKNFLLDEIKENESLLSNTRKQKTDKLTELNLLDKKITARNKLIQNLKTKANLLNKQIDTTSNAIKNLKIESENLKQNYAKMIKGAYKKRNSSSLWFFVFSANTFNDAIKRYKYLSQYSNFRKEQLNIIENNEQKLNIAKQTLTQKLKQVEQTKVEENMQAKNLKKEKGKKDALLLNIKKQEKRIAQQIEEKKKESENLSKKISDIITKEIAAAKAKASKNKSKTATTKNYELTPAAKALSNSFYKNKGKFGWPVDRGFISEKFGKHKHKFLKRVTTNNKGVNIATKKNASVKCIFNGEVVNVFKMPLLQTTIIISHGNYFTVYANIKESFVKRGDKIKTNEKIGTVYTNTKSNTTEVHLEIWKGQQNLNPAYWLKKR